MASLSWPGGSKDLGESPILVGRDPVACDVALEHDTLLSRLHFAVVPGPGATFLLDLRSSNGTFVNGGRVHYSRLRHGDQIRAGSGRFEFKDEAPVRAPWVLLPEPSVSFLAGGTADTFVGYLRHLSTVEGWQEALDAAVDGLARWAETEGLAGVGTYALGLKDGDPVALTGRGAPVQRLDEVVGPLIRRLREVARPYLVENPGRQAGFLPQGYPIRVENVWSLAAAPLGPGGEFGLLCLLSPQAEPLLGPHHLLVVEQFALPLGLAIRGIADREAGRG